MKTTYINTTTEYNLSYTTQYMLIGIRGYYTAKTPWYRISHPYQYVEVHSYESITMYCIR